ncbi:MAG: hypothetical protein ACXWQJ_15575 [Bdellovibrionota bacterium]
MLRFAPLTLLLLTAFVCASPIASASAEGPSGSGGGALIEAAFRLRAGQLIAKIATSPEANQLCSADLMAGSFQKTKIRVVDELIDPSTGKAPVDTNLDAWTIPGDMQLKKEWQEFFRHSEAREGRSLDILILHEIYRTTKTCNDDQFAISEKIPPLFALPSSSTQVYRLTTKISPDNFTIYAYKKKSSALDGGDSYYSSDFAVCNLSISDKKNIGKTITCLVLANNNDTHNMDNISFAVGTSLVQGKLTRYRKTIAKENYKLEDIDVSFQENIPQPPGDSFRYSGRETLMNMLTQVSAEHPLYLVYDTESDAWSYGLNLAKLKPL